MIALARKYRPRSFADVAVQTHVSNTLRGAIARGRVAHGYLLCGPRGTGKTTLARVLAMALNCERRLEATAAGAPDTGEPCGECASCTRIWSGAASLDVVEIDAASNRGVDDARELRERAMYAPSGEHRWKVYIIDEAHMLTREAWNALLKILEEPPSRVVFVFATTEPQKIAQLAAPILSRLQRFDFKRIGLADLTARLSTVLAAEGIEADDDALSMIARAADGSMRDALSLADQVLAMSDRRVVADRVREALGLVPEDEVIAVLDIIAARRPADVFGAVGRLVDMGVDLAVFFGALSDMLRAQLAVTLGAQPAGVSEAARAALVQRKDALAAGDQLRMLNMLAELEPRFRRSAQQQLLLETALLRFTLLDHTIAIEDLLQSLAGHGEQGSPARGTDAARPREAMAPPPRLEGRGGRRGDTPAGVPRVRDVESAGAPRSAASRTAAGGAPHAGITGLDAAPDGGTATIPRADSGAARASAAIGDLNAIAGAWDDMVATVRRERPMVATLLEQTVPMATDVRGSLTLHVAVAAVHDGLRARLDDIVTALQPHIAGLQRVALKGSDDARPLEATPRMTVEAVKLDTLASLRKRDPVLAAAIDVLDLELLD